MVSDWLLLIDLLAGTFFESWLRARIPAIKTEKSASTYITRQKSVSGLIVFIGIRIIYGWLSGLSDWLCWFRGLTSNGF